MKCPTCGKGVMCEGETVLTTTVSGMRFDDTVAAKVCFADACGEAIVDCEVLVRSELWVASELSRHGVRTGEAFKFMRKALGLRGTDLADLFDVTSDTVSRWERGATGLDVLPFVMLGILVEEERLRGLWPRTRERLKAAKEGPPRGG